LKRRTRQFRPVRESGHSPRLAPFDIAATAEQNHGMVALLFASRPWPDAADLTTILVFLGLGVGLPIVGYWFMVADIRAYLRALKGALVCVVDYLSDIPDWARRENPPCFRALSVSWPCTEADVRRAYHFRAQHLHPDRGGDRQRFQRLKKHYEEALFLVRMGTEEASSRESALATQSVQTASAAVQTG